MAQENSGGSDDQLPVVTVESDDRKKSTEETGSYTTHSQTTATPLELGLQETPQSVSVITRQQIQDMNLRTTGSILLSAPGISATRTDSNRYALSARGYALDNIQFDGLSSPIMSQWNYGVTSLSASIYDRVEVVRGATGLMSGSGNPSAAVNFIRKRPLPGFAAAAELSAGSWNSRVATADVSTPLSADGRIKGRIVAETATSDSYISWLDSRSNALYGIVTAALAPTTELTAGIEHQTDRNNGFGGGFPLFYNDGSRTEFDRSASGNARWARMQTTSGTAFLDLTHRFANQWRIRTAYSRQQGDYALRSIYRSGYPDRQTGTGMNPFFSRYEGQRTRNEFHVVLSGPFSLFGTRHEAALGWMRTNDRSNIINYPAIPPLPAIGSFFDWRQDHIAEPAWSTQAKPADDRRTSQSGAYATGHFALAPGLHGIVGGRLSSWELDQLYFRKSQTERRRNVFTPYGGLVYELTPEYSIYASYTSIFTPQYQKAPDGSTLPPATNRTREIGLKGNLLDGHLNTSATLFQGRQSNLAQAIPGETVLGLAGTKAYRTVAGAEVTGVELEATGELNARHSISTSFTRFVARDATGTPINTSQPSTLFKLFTRYHWSDRLDIGGGTTWQNRIYQSADAPQGKVVVSQASYMIASLMARYRLNNRLSLAANVNNLFDRRYYSQIGNYSQGWWGEPRSFNLTLRADY